MPDLPLSDIRDQVGESHVCFEDFRIEAGKVEEFARAVKDDNPVHRDDDAAREAGFDANPAPLTFTRVSRFPRYARDGLGGYLGFDLRFDPERTVHGEQRYEFERPVRVGDILTGVVTLDDVYEREGGRGGNMTFATLSIEYRDQDDDLVLTETMTRIEMDADGKGSDDE